MNSIKFILLSLLIFVFSRCGKENKKISIAIMTKLEYGSLVGSSEINTAKIFIEKNKINNIEIVPFDDSWDIDKTIKAYQAVKQKKINILITSHVSTCALVIKDSINKDSIFTFATGSTTDLLSNHNDFIFRNIQDVEKEQKSIAQYINENHFKKILIIRDTLNHGYTYPASQHIKKYLIIKPVKEILINIDNIDMIDLKNEYENFEFDLVYLLIGGYKTNAGSIAQLIHQSHPDCKFLFTPWMKTPVILETTGDVINNCIMPSHYPPRGVSTNVDDYVKEFKNKFGIAPTSISLNVYTALEIIHQAILKGYSKPNEIKSFIDSHRNFNTNFGKITFNSFGDVDAPLYFINDIPKEF